MSGFIKRSPVGRNKGDKTRSNAGFGRTNNVARPNLQPPLNETGTVLGINGKLLHGFLCGCVAWWCWPSDPYYWGFYIYSVILWAACVCFIFEGIRSFFKLRGAKKRWAEIEALGSRPKNAQIVDKSDLQDKGMN